MRYNIFSILIGIVAFIVLLKLLKFAFALIGAAIIVFAIMVFIKMFQRR